jgi:hypothetical protein
MARLAGNEVKVDDVLRFEVGEPVATGSTVELTTPEHWTIQGTIISCVGSEATVIITSLKHEMVH